ncbi:hypothetical protein ABYF32_05665 [Buchananella felis]|uniref:hypothetical protein n=1 Tax=Buchananella felis TaxID=3231492 RepID=UPI0035287428
MQKDISTRALPLDRWLYPSNHAMSLEIWERMVVKCMWSNGIAERKVNRDSSAPFPEDAPTGKLADRLFNVRIAQKYGYRPAPNPQNPWTEEQQRAGDGFAGNSSLRDEWKKCMEPASEEFLARYGESQLDVSNRLSGIADLNRVGVNRDSMQAVAAAQRWRECMAPLGIPDLPEQPFDKTRYHIPETLQQRFDWYAGGQPGAEEIEFAVHDAQCRVSSGWDQTLYEDEWAQQEAFVNAHRAELDAAAQQSEQDAIKLRALLAEVQAEK